MLAGFVSPRGIKGDTTSEASESVTVPTTTETNVDRADAFARNFPGRCLLATIGVGFRFIVGTSAESLIGGVGAMGTGLSVAGVKPACESTGGACRIL